MSDSTNVQEPPQPPPPPPPPSSGWGVGRVIGLICASIVALIGVGLLLAGAGVIAVHSLARDDDGFYSSDRESLRAPWYAITTSKIDLDANVANDLPDELLGTLRVQAESDSGQPLFVGIGRSADVSRYLAGVAHSEFVDFRRGRAVFELIPGRRRPAAPGAQSFWVAQSEGSGDQRVEWDPEQGVWTVAVLNADGSRGLAVGAEIGAKVSWLIWAGLGLLVVGLVFTGTAIYAIVALGRRSERAAAAPGHE